MVLAELFLLAVCLVDASPACSSSDSDQNWKFGLIP
jgi:hypothetical protein